MAAVTTPRSGAQIMRFYAHVVLMESATSVTTSRPRYRTVWQGRPGFARTHSGCERTRRCGSVGAARGVGACYSLRRMAAGGIWAARHLGPAEMRLATIKATGMIASTVGACTAGSAATPNDPAKIVQDHRPTTMPSGRPASRATAVSAHACDSTTLSSCGRSRPSVLSRARSRRRRRTLVSSTWVSVAMANRARAAARTSGVSRTPERLVGLGGDVTVDQCPGRRVLADLPADEQRPAAGLHAGRERAG